jgi:hypothetical protein
VFCVRKRRSEVEYDAYLIACARQNGAPLITLDRGLARAARRLGIELLEVS